MPRTRTVDQLQSELLEKLREIRDKMAADVSILDARIALLTGKSPLALTAGRGRRGGRRGKRAKVAKAPGRRRQVGGGAGKPLKAFLAEALETGGTMRARDLTEAVLAAGYTTKDRNFRQTVASALAGDRRFRRIRRGIYKLAAAK